MINSTQDRTAKYQQYGVSDMDSNPLIAALTPPTDIVKEQLERLKLKPDHNESERNLPASVRTFLLNRLQHNFFFPSTQHVQIYKDIEAQVFGGYWARNPMSAKGQRLVHNAGTPGPHIEQPHVSVAERCESVGAPMEQDLGGGDTRSECTSNSPSAATIAFLTGLSGSGKTSLVRRVAAALGKPVITHSSFRGQSFTDSQVVVLMRNCSDQPNYTTKAIAKLLADRVDELLGVTLYGHIFQDKSMTRTHYVAELRKILTNNWVGVVIIDVFEHLSLAGTLGRDELIAMLVNLRDELGVPILLVGTYKAAEVLNAASASVTRRFVDGGFYDLKRPESSGDKDFQSFCDIAWKYQWVKNPVIISDEIKDTFYDLSQGVTAVFLMLFKLSQLDAIRSGAESVNAGTLRKTYADRLFPLHKILDALRSRDRNLLDKYDDLYLRAFSEVESTDLTNRLNMMLNQKNGQQAGIDTAEADAPEELEQLPPMSAALRATEVMGSATRHSDDLF